MARAARLSTVLRTRTELAAFSADDFDRVGGGSVPCELCDAVGCSASDYCSCCKGAGAVDLHDVGHDHLGLFADVAGADAALRRRGYAAWGRDADGEIVALDREDVETGAWTIVRWVAPTGPGLRRSSAPPPATITTTATNKVA